MSRKLKDEQAKWYAILEREGFKDIEKNFQFDSYKFVQKKFKHNVALDENQSYYLRAFEFLEDYSFKNPTEKTIWLYHTNGDSCRTIAEKINQKKLKKSTINKIIAKLRKIMLTSY